MSARPLYEFAGDDDVFIVRTVRESWSWLKRDVRARAVLKGLGKQVDGASIAQNAQGVVNGVVKGVTRASLGRRTPPSP